MVQLSHNNKGVSPELSSRVIRIHEQPGASIDFASRDKAISHSATRVLVSSERRYPPPGERNLMVIPPPPEIPIHLEIPTGTVVASGLATSSVPPSLFHPRDRVSWSRLREKRSKRDSCGIENQTNTFVTGICLGATLPMDRLVYISYLQNCVK